MDRTLIPAWRNGTLMPVDKLEVHRRGLRHRAVSVFVIVEGALLIQRRAMGKYHTPGLWANSCCTHPFWEEESLTCAARRLDEELGIGGLDLEALGEVEYRAGVGGGMIEHEVVEMVRATPETRPEVRADPDEVMDVRWIRPGDLAAEIATEPARFTPWMRIYMAEHGARILGGTG